MVRAVRQGMSMRAAARRFDVSLSVVRRWVQRAAGARLDRVDWDGRSSRPHSTTRTSPQLEDLILDLRRHLRDESPLGHYGADAVCTELLERHGVRLSRSTVARILRRRGAVERRRRVRFRSPPRGWHLPDVMAGELELDSFDFIEQLVIEDGPRFDVMTAISLHGGLSAAFPVLRRSAVATVDCLLSHWRDHGLPSYAQFDNDTVFQGARQHVDAVGRVSRLCLSLGVTPVFAAPREHGLQNAIESFNAHWQAKVWRRRHYASIEQLSGDSARYLAAHRRQRAARLQSAPFRRTFPTDWVQDLGAPLRGCLVYVRRADEHGRVLLLGRTFDTTSHWSHRLVRAVVDLDQDVVRFHGLSRRNPCDQPLLRTTNHHIPRRPFRG